MRPFFCASSGYGGVHNPPQRLRPFRKSVDAGRYIATLQGMSDESEPAYEALTMYAIGSPLTTTSKIRYLAYEIQQLCKTNGLSSYLADNLIAIGRNLGFTRDRIFMDAVGGARQSPSDLSKLWRLHTYCWAISTALAVDGDLVECGVFEGLYAATALGTLGAAIEPTRTFYLYDTFQGLDARYATEHEIEMSGTDFSAAGLEESVRSRFAPWPNVKVIAGTVPDVLHSDAPEHVAFLHLDMNSAKAEIAALEFFYDRIPDGGVILLDDFGRSEYRAMFEAYERWFGDCGQRILELPTGQGMIIKRTVPA
jgi:O-methyltransferase